MKDLVKLSLEIATRAHRGQFRHDGKTPYITHPIAVAEGICRTWGARLGGKQTAIAIALLHDVVEDSDITCIDLFNDEGVPRAVIDVVSILTKIKDRSYLDYILRIKENLFAKLVKIEDIKHNLSTLSKRNKSQRDKYLLALYILEN